ncbi:quinate 5-dehydrogenase [bacterium]|nr:quinate 5-dehydrogenase [bacterium]
MKKAISISIGSSQRDKSVTTTLLGEEVHIERVGTDGDMDAAREMFRSLDGQMDAFGVGGADLGLFVDDKWYPLHSILPLVQDVTRTPVVDGCGLKNTLEARAASILETEIGDYLDQIGRKALVMTAVDRYGLLRTFTDAGYECLFGDAMFSLGVRLPIRKESGVKLLGALLIPVLSRLPFSWIYPVGEEQLKRTPKFEWAFEQASVIAGDCHYITRYMPNDLAGKVIVTNTTTEHDVHLFREAGVKYLMTTTPVYDGRSFGTNMMEAALLAASGYTDKVDYRNYQSHFAMMAKLVDQVGLRPQLQVLN